MRRSVRNGLAIAGMAGGIFLLGDAVAGASTDANAAGDITSNTAGQPGDATSTNLQGVAASNDVDNTAKTGDVHAGGGSPSVGVVAGNGNTVEAGSVEGDVSASQDVTTVVDIAVEANGGTVSGSNNAAAGNGASNSANASGSIDSTTAGGSGSGYGGGADSTNVQGVTAGNDVDNTAKTGYVDASGGNPSVGVLAGNGNTSGAGSYKGDVESHQDVDSEVHIAIEANGGEVHDSNNAMAGNGATNEADAEGDIDSVTAGGSGTYDDADSANVQGVEAENDVDNTATTGDVDASGGNPMIDVVAGNGNTLYCSSVKGDVICNQNINVIINIIAEANGGTVTCSNNAAAGNAAEWVCKLPAAPAPAPAPAPVAPVAPVAQKGDTDRPEYKAAPVAAKPALYSPAPVKAAPVKAMSSAQPTSQLASTGADVSVPLTVGLLALAAGTGLAFATRRRTEAQAV